MPLMTDPLRVLLVAAYPAINFSASLAALRAAALSDDRLASRIDLKLLVFGLGTTDVSKHWVGMGSNDLGVLVDDIVRLDARVVGFSLYPWNFRLFDEVASVIKEVRPKTIVVGGGPSIQSLLHGHHFDILLDGEGEERFPALLKAVLAIPGPLISEIPGLYVRRQHGYEWTGMPGDFPDLTHAPSGLLSCPSLPRDVVSIETSRGCAFRCAFCSWGKGSKPRYFSQERVLAEIDMIHSREIERVFISDSALNLDRRRAEAIIRHILAHHNGKTKFSFELMIETLQPSTARLIGELSARGGIDMCGAGLQAVEKEVMTAIARPFRSDVFAEKFTMLRRSAPAAPVTVDVMFGLPRGTLRSVLQTLEFCVRLGASRVHLFRCSATPGSAMARQPELFGVSAQAEPPFLITRAGDLHLEDLVALSVFALYWRRTALSMAATLRFVSLVTGGRAASIAWEVFLAERRKFESWPAIELSGWGAEGFQQALAEAYDRELHADQWRHDLLSQLRSFDDACDRVRNGTAGERGSLAIRRVGRANEADTEVKAAVVSLRSEAIHFLKTGDLVGRPGRVFSPVRVEQVTANLLDKNRTGPLVCVLP